METVYWLSEPNGFLKLIILVLSLILMILGFMYGGNFVDHNGVYDDFVLRLALVILPTNIIVTAWFIVAYIFDENMGYTWRAELVFTVINALFNLPLAAISLYNCADWILRGDPIVYENMVFGTLLLMLACVFYMDMVCYVLQLYKTPFLEDDRGSISPSEEEPRAGVIKKETLTVKTTTTTVPQPARPPPPPTTRPPPSTGDKITISITKNV